MYQRYTGKNNERVVNNLRLLVERERAEDMLVCVPLISGYNRKRKGKNFTKFTTVGEGEFWFYLERRRRLWFAKEGYQEQKVRVKKKNASGLRVVLKKEE